MTKFQSIRFLDIASPPKPRPNLNQEVQRAPEISDLVWAPQSKTLVKRRGERLSSPIYWRGRQWAVTRFGVECRDGLYPISSERLWEDEVVFGWVKHVCLKEWVDKDDFVEALRIARSLAERQNQGTGLSKSFFRKRCLPPKVADIFANQVRGEHG